MTDHSRLFDEALDAYRATRSAEVDVQGRHGEVALQAGLAAVRGRRRRRRATQAAAALAVALAVVLGLATLKQRPGSTPAPGTSGRGPSEIAKSWQTVADRPGIAERLAVHPDARGVRRLASTTPSRVRRLDDAGLGEWLRRSGRSEARIRVGEEVLVPGVARTE